MPKRKRDKDIDKISKKLRKLERKLKRAKQRSLSPPSSNNQDNITPLAHTAEKIHLEVDEMDIEPDIIHYNEINVEPTRSIVTPESDILNILHQELNSQPQPTESPVLVHKNSSESNTVAASASDPTVSIDVDSDNLSELLGQDPSDSTEYGGDIHVGLSKRLEHILLNGLDSDTRKELNKKYLCPANCTRINPPLLNPEIKAALPEQSVKRDKGIENRQKQVSTAIACLSEMITTQLQEKDKNQTLLKQLMDATKLMCDSLHSDSTRRRYFALSSLKKDVNDHLVQTKIDKYLFGEGLAETLKMAKAVSKSSDEIKADYNKNNKKSIQQQPSTSRGLNWRAPAPARRQPGPQRSRYPYQPAGQRTTAPPPVRPPPTHAASSRTSRYQPRAARHN